MNIPIQHIIGTVALISLVISAGLVFSVFTSAAENDNKKQQLNQIAENIALNLVEMTNLVTFANYTYSPIIKILDLPTDLSGSTYTIELVDGTNLGEGYSVRANLTSNQHITASSLIPTNSGINLRIYANPATTQISAGIDSTAVICSNIVYGKSHTVVWGRAGLEINETDPEEISIRFIEVGLGWLP